MPRCGIIYTVWTMLLVCTMQLAAGEHQPLKPLIVVDDRAYPPFAFLDDHGRPQGITVDIWATWSRRTGIPVDFQLKPWEEALAAVRNGQADAVGGLFRTASREADFAYVRFGVNIPTGIFFHHRITGIRGLADVRPFQVGVVAGDSAEELMHDKAEAIATFPGVDVMVDAAIDGRINVFVADAPTVWYYLLRRPGGEEFRQADTHVATNQLSPGARIGNAELLQQLQAGFDAMPASEVEAIVTTWTGHAATARIPWRLIVGVSSALLVVVVAVVVWNRTLRRRVEAITADLRESDERFRQEIARAPEAIIMIDPERDVIIAANPRAEIIYGVPHQRILGARPADFSPTFQPDGELSEAKARRVQQAAIAGTEQVLTWQHRRPDGGELPCEVRLVAVPWKGRTLVRASVIDLSERRRAEELRHRTEKSLALGELAGGVAHDFNNVLAGVLGYSQLLAERIEDAKAKAYAEHIMDAVVQAKALTKRLLAFARQGATTPEPFDGQAAAVAALDLFAAARQPGITVIRTLEAAGCRILGFPGLFQNAILNLCFNARDAMPQGGRLTVTSTVVELGATDLANLAPYEIRPGKHWHLAVADDGTGMSAEVLTRCLEPLFTTKGDQGTGLGLPSVQACVVEHHGAMRIDSLPGQGTTIHLWLPLVVEQRQPTGGLILVVDDEPQLRQNTVELLTAAGYRAHGLPDGEAAVAWVRDHPGEVALVLLDMHMPKLDGARAFAALHDLAPDLAVFLTSGGSDELPVAALLRLGLRGVLAKPIRAQTLLDTVACVAAVGKPA